MEQAGREDWMLSKGIENKRKAIGEAKEDDLEINCFHHFCSYPFLYSFFSLITQSAALTFSVSAQIPGHF